MIYICEFLYVLPKNLINDKSNTYQYGHTHTMKMKLQWICISSGLGWEGPVRYIGGVPYSTHYRTTVKHANYFATRRAPPARSPPRPPPHQAPCGVVRAPCCVLLGPGPAARDREGAVRRPARSGPGRRCTGRAGASRRRWDDRQSRDHLLLSVLQL